MLTETTDIPDGLGCLEVGGITTSEDGVCGTRTQDQGDDQVKVLSTGGAHQGVASYARKTKLRLIDTGSAC